MVNLEELINCISNCVTLFYHGSLYEHFDVHLVTSNIFFFAPSWSNYWNNSSLFQFFFSSQLYFRCILDYLPAPVISLLYLLAYYNSWFKSISGAKKKQPTTYKCIFRMCIFSSSYFSQMLVRKHRRTCLHFLHFLWVFQAASPRRSLLLYLLVLCWSARHAARALSSLFVLLSKPDNCSRLHLSIVSSAGRSEEFPSPPGATPSCLCSSPRLLPCCHRGLPC